MNYPNSNTETRQNQATLTPSNSLQSIEGKAYQSRPVEIPTDPPDPPERLDGWSFLLADAISLAPWSLEASLFVDRAIVIREGGRAE